MNPLARFALHLVPLALCTAVPGAQAPLIEVPGTAALQAAIDAAPDGAVLLIRTGLTTSSPVRISAKSLTLQSDTGRRRLRGGLEVSDLTPDQSVYLHSIDIEALDLHDNAGLVWVENCVVSAPYAGLGLQLDACADVVLLRTSVAGGEVAGLGAMSSGGHGVLSSARSSSLHAYDCTFAGGDTESHERDARGGDAVRLVGSGDFAFFSGCELRGGDTLACRVFGCEFSGYGGDALRCQGVARVHDSLLVEGHNTGLTHFPCAPCSPAFDGELEVGPDIHHLPGRALKVGVPAPVREGEMFQVHVEGPRGAPVWMAMAGTSSVTFLDGTLIGSMLLPIVPMPERVLVGFTDRDGRLDRTLAVPALDPSVEALPVFWQFFTMELDGLPRPTAMFDGRHLRGGRWQLGAGTMVLQLDESF